jgi:AcrR family transcriptional regulator
MLDDDSKRSKAVRATLELARERDWGDISLSDIAQAAGLTLADLRREFTWKSDILKAFQAAVDTEVLTRVESVRRRKGCPS